MQIARKCLLILSFLFIQTLILLQFGCGKFEVEERPPTPDPEPEIHKGWHESMKGRMLFTSRYSAGGGEGIRDHLFEMDKDSATKIELPEKTGYINGGIEWSPDGSLIAFANYNDGLFRMNSDGTGVVNLYYQNEARSPSWSPDGTFIAFVSMDIIGVIEHRTLLKRKFYFNLLALGTLDWSPNDTLIAFEYHYQDFGLKTLNVMDSTITEISDGQAKNPVWSPDGSKIAYARVVGLSDRDIYTIQADGSGFTKVCSFADLGLKVLCFDLAWSPDGKLIAAGGKEGIYIIDLSGKPVAKIETEGEVHNMDWR
jgi:WD40 repeat protein